MSSWRGQLQASGRTMSPPRFATLPPLSWKASQGYGRTLPRNASTLPVRLCSSVILGLVTHPPSLLAWSSRPQLRAVQAICLKISYTRPSSQGQKPGLDGCSFFVWLSAATRICQLLGYHRLTKDPDVMPEDDPGLPARPCVLKRELALRTWHWIVTHDWMFCTSEGMNQVAINSCSSLSLVFLTRGAFAKALLLSQYSGTSRRRPIVCFT